MSSVDRAAIIARVCAALSDGDTTRAKTIGRTEYPTVPTPKTGRRYSEGQSLRIFWRDGFVDRYSGQRLILPGALRLISHLLPEEFPAHPNWKMSESHFVYWELFPTVDHVIPVSRGGEDRDSNWVCTSMLRNSAKAHWTLEELGWALSPPGDTHDWDGLTRWFVDYVRAESRMLEDRYVARWFRAASQLLDAG